jgi:DegV family protein with EDD domain
MVREMGVEILPLSFNIGGQNYLDYPYDKRISAKEFYDGLRSGKTSTTSQVNVEEFTEKFETCLKEGKDVLYIAFSSGLSGTFASSETAANDLRKKYPHRKIKLVDSLCASMGEGLFVYMAVKMKKNGMDIDELENFLNNDKLKICHWVVVDDLHHLRRGGRISSANAFIGSMLGVKPILKMDSFGKLVVVTKIRGRQKALDFLLDKMDEIGLNLGEQDVFISHGDCEEDAESLKKAIKSRFGVRDVKINLIGTVIGTHAGPGTLALFFAGKGR